MIELFRDVLLVCRHYFNSKLPFCGVGLIASHRSITGCKVDLKAVMNAF